MREKLRRVGASETLDTAWKVPVNHCGFNGLALVSMLELELGSPFSCRPMIGCEPHGRGVLATIHYRIPEKAVEVGSNNKGGRC